ncbi:MAG: gliding motility-associated ABC transporter ATP-binding subunit GldA [Ferruginibacter sp.]|nr:gliding motility-associated ABC transporter ATP-binding subunit GldA [Ferruginibacter sp.]
MKYTNTPLSMSISISNLTKTYGTQKAVNNISFNINEGEIVGFLGPNGAGKSTTMKMITGYLDADAGLINVSGINVSKDNMESKKKIGYLPEANPLYFEMYVREYLHFTAGIHRLKKANEKVEAIIKTVGLSLEANKKIGQLSKGYKQRVGLAAALIHEPEVLILDEPTSGLDPNQIIEIRNVIKALAKNKTVLFSSHILQEVEAICDRVIIINKGNIVADDTLKNLQSTNGQQQFVTVNFQEKLHHTDLQSLSAAINVNENGNSFRIQTKDANMLRKQILQFSIDKNLNIISLQNETNSLEDVFRGLTIAD